MRILRFFPKHFVLTFHLTLRNTVFPFLSSISKRLVFLRMTPTSRSFVRSTPLKLQRGQNRLFAKESLKKKPPRPSLKREGLSVNFLMRSLRHRKQSFRALLRLRLCRLRATIRRMFFRQRFRRLMLKVSAIWVQTAAAVAAAL
jgi:hypothetical protein